MKLPLALVLAVCLFASVASAQTFRGGVQGTVTDESGAMVPGATITVINSATGLRRLAVTDDKGAFFISELPLGPYDVEAALSGFATQARKGVDVGVGASVRLDFVLRVNDVQADVLVEATPLIDTTKNDKGGTISGAQAAEIPLNGRDFVKLLTLVPGSTGDASGINDSPGSFGLFSINGNRGRSNNYLLDGTDMNDGYRNLPAINEAGVFGTPATVLPLEGIQEVAVLSNFEAQYGRNSGSVVDIVTKSGTNQFHGAVFEFLRNDKFDARNFFNQEPDPQTHLRNNQFGG